ncbi:MAG: PAS domain-containing protein, partial [Candidatus Hydrothermarchaeaceae archaeon]
MAKGAPIDAPLLRAMVDSIGEGILVLRPDYTITFVNESLARLMKMKREELFGKTCYKVFHDRESVCDDCPVQTTLASGEPAFTVHRGRVADLVKTHVALSAYPITDSGGRITRIVMTVRDVKPLFEAEEKLERKLREHAEDLEAKIEERTKELKRSEEKYRSLAESNPDAIFIVDKKSGKITDINDAVCNLLGYSRDEIIGTVVGSRVVPAQKDVFKREFVKHRKGGKFTGEFEFRKKDGSTVPVDVRGSAFGDYLFGVVRDITERKRAEEEIHQQQEELQIILDSVPALVFYKDKEDRFIRVN